MSFDRLHPLLAHHIVNSLGWKQLRPLQEACIRPILDGRHGIFLAPTAGGKTEAALFPLLSQMLFDPQRGLNLLYICPIKALLNNLEHRLSYYAGLLGLRAAVWHGDTSERQRSALRKDPPEILLTTPESLEVMLVSKRVDKEHLFGSVRFCIVDEIHAFAGDDRGRHLLAVLQRIQAYSRVPLQRLGLSATVGNPQTLLAWLQGPATTPGVVLAPPGPARAAAHVSLDYVGSLANAALVISRLFRGEKRLVFVDSRTRVESLAVALRELGVTTYVSHGSLGIEARNAAERAFAQEENCVIVATSTLELGIDVGDLDRVIQVDAPATVASFLQRIGRTGRRAGTVANCLFLATDDEALLRAASLLHLWGQGYVEPVTSPPLPFHILAQQMMALCLEQGSMTTRDLETAAASAFGDLAALDRAAVLDHMLAQGILHREDGLIWMGDEGEACYGRKNFMELFAVFTSPPLFTVYYGRKELGQVHEHTFMTEALGPQDLTLGGLPWRVRALDWSRRVAQVVPGEVAGKSRWLSPGVPLGFDLCQGVAAILGETPLDGALLTKRGAARLELLREQMSPCRPGALVVKDDSRTWWTFAGTLLNQAAVAAFAKMGLSAQALPLAVVFKDGEIETLRQGIERFLAMPEDEVLLPINKEMLAGLKFQECLPADLIERLFAARLNVTDAFRFLRSQSYNKSADPGGRHP